MGQVFMNEKDPPVQTTTARFIRSDDGRRKLKTIFPLVNIKMGPLEMHWERP